MSEFTPNLHLFKYNPDTDGKEVFSLTQALNNNWDVLDERCGSQRNIGEIVASTIPLTDAGLHLLDGSLIQGDGIYSAFVTYIAGLDLTANYFCTEQEWQQSITDYGVCGKFVYDSTNNTVRLPKVTGFIEGTTDVTALGNLVEAGLPNITGSVNNTNYGNAAVGYYNSREGALAPKGSGTSYASPNAVTSDNATSGITLDASLSSSIYGNSDTVQPQTIKAFYYIVIATSTKTDIEVDIDQVATDLNGKVNTSDLAEVQCVIETYNNGDSGYRIWSDGWCDQWGTIATGTSLGASNYTLTFLKPFSSISSIKKFGGFAKSGGSATFGQLIFQNGNITTTTAVVSLVAYGSNGNITHSTSGGTCYWYASGYII